MSNVPAPLPRRADLVSWSITISISAFLFISKSKFKVNPFKSSVMIVSPRSFASFSFGERNFINELSPIDSVSLNGILNSVFSSVVAATSITNSFVGP